MVGKTHSPIHFTGPDLSAQFDLEAKNRTIEFGTQKWRDEHRVALTEANISPKAQELLFEHMNLDDFSGLSPKEIANMAELFELHVRNPATVRPEEIASYVRVDVGNYQYRKLTEAREAVLKEYGQEGLDKFDAALNSFRDSGLGAEALLYAVSGNKTAVNIIRDALGEEAPKFETVLTTMSTIDDSYFEVTLAYDSAQDMMTEIYIEQEKQKFLDRLQAYLQDLLKKYVGDTSSRLAEEIRKLIYKLETNIKLSNLDKLTLGRFMANPIPA